MQIEYAKKAAKYIKKLVLAWNPDYTKLTLSEKRMLDEAEKEEAGLP